MNKYKSRSLHTLILILTLTFFSCTHQEANNNTALEESKKFGDKNITENDAISGEELVNLLKDRDSIHIKVKSKILEVCPKKGCWMDVDLGNDQTMFVRFMDYGFFMPLDAAGKTAIIEGIAKVERLSVEWLRHKAEDEGKSQGYIDSINKPLDSYSIAEATGVILQ